MFKIICDLQISYLKERCKCVFCAYVHFMNQMCAYLRDDRKIKFRMVSTQNFINEAPEVLNADCFGQQIIPAELDSTNLRTFKF